jgi:hypothetical protein
VMLKHAFAGLSGHRPVAAGRRFGGIPPVFPVLQELKEEGAWHW